MRSPLCYETDILEFKKATNNCLSIFTNTQFSFNQSTFILSYILGLGFNK